MAPFFRRRRSADGVVEPAARRLLAVLPARRGARGDRRIFCSASRILRRMLRRQFSDGVVLATLICLTWGTNLFHYAVFDGTFSHAYAFFLVCAWLWLVERWWDRPTLWRSVAIGAVAALNVLVRHTNAIFVLLLPLYGIVGWRDVRRARSSCAIGGAARPGRGGRRRGAGAAARALQMGHRPVARQRVRHTRDGLLVWVAAPGGAAVQHAEGAVLLVADSAVERGRRLSWRPDGPGRSSFRPSCCSPFRPG